MLRFHLVRTLQLIHDLYTKPHQPLRVKPFDEVLPITAAAVAQPTQKHKSSILANKTASLKAF